MSLVKAALANGSLREVKGSELNLYNEYICVNCSNKGHFYVEMLGSRNGYNVIWDDGELLAKTFPQDSFFIKYYQIPLAYLEGKALYENEEVWRVGTKDKYILFPWSGGGYLSIVSTLPVYKIPLETELSISEWSLTQPKAKVTINGVDVDKPETELPENNQKYYMPSLFTNIGYTTSIWFGSNSDLNYLNQGLVHLNPESAKKHAEALLLFFSKKDA